MKMRNQSLTKGRMIGYASGIISETVVYNMFFTYFLLFLTDIVHLSPILAGAVGLISVMWDAVADPIIGYVSDGNGVDRRKYILIAALPIGLFFMAAFLKIDGSDLVKFIYYVVTSMIFWLSYTMYTIPYYALCAELTEDYDERTKIRGISSFISAFGIFIGAAGPVLLVDLFKSMGLSEGISWFVAAVVISVLSSTVAFLVYYVVKDVPLVKSNEKKEERDGLLRTYMSILKLKPFRWLLLFIFFYLVGSSILVASVIYLIEYRVGLSKDTMTYVLLTTVVGMIVLVPVVTWLSTKFDRRITCIIFLSIEVIGLLVLKWIGITSFFTLMIFSVISTFGVASFWTVFYPMTYDLVEVDEFINGKRREGGITSFPQFIQKMGAAIGLQVTGIALSVIGYYSNQMIQTKQVVLGIESISTLVAAGFIFLSIVALVKYPITKKRFRMIVTELEKKRRNEVYSTEVIKELL